MIGGPALGGVLALFGVVSFWGFTVDDAWIITRIVIRGLRGEGFQFHADFPSDAVTPLGFERWLAFLTSLWGRPSVDSAFLVARWTGGAVCVFSFALAASRAYPLLGKARLAMGLLGSLPAFIWATAGLATPWVGCALVGGVIAWRRSSALGAFLLGAASAWRPELIPFSLTTLAILEFCSDPGRFAQSRRAPRLLGLGLAWVLLPAGVSCWRWWRFGHWLPLSALAKVPSFELGLHYAAVTVVWGGLFGWLLLSPASRWLRWPLVSHCLALVFAGGDWMPALRLTAPLYPTLLVLWSMQVSEDVSAPVGSRWQRWGHRVLGLWVPLECLLIFRIHSDLVHVVERRTILVRQGRPLLVGAKAVAAVDVGWVGLASPDRIIDLGGVTDPRLARIPGTHTNRRLAPGLFSARGIDAWVVLAWRDLPLAHPQAAVYGTDQRLLAQGAAADMRWVATLPLQGTQQEYRVLRSSSLQVANGHEAVSPKARVGLVVAFEESVEDPAGIPCAGKSCVRFDCSELLNQHRPLRGQLGWRR